MGALSIAALVAAVVLGLNIGLKLVTNIGAIWWLRNFGPAYRKLLEARARDQLRGSAIRKLVDECQGYRVWPWGILDYQLLRRGTGWRVFARWFHRWPTLPVATTAIYFVFLFSGAVPLKSPAAIAWCVTAILYQIGVVLIAAEGVAAYVAIGNYRRHYHVGIRLSDNALPDFGEGMYELDIWLPVVTSAVLTNTFAFVATFAATGSFHSTQISISQADPWSIIWNGAYFVTTTMSTVGFGDIVPANAWGQVVAMLLELQSLLLFVGMFSSLLAFGIKTNSAEK